MLFNSFTFVIFFAVVFSLYWLLRDRSRQNHLLLLASYVFYGAWSWQFLLLLMASTLFDYLCGVKIDSARDAGKRKFWLLLCAIGNLGLLCTFKYLGFFVEQTAALAHALGLQVSLPVLEIVLPIGISFYTFQSMGYVIDVYRRKISATRDLPEYALYVAFFPQLVAGPIERAAHMLPQFRSERRWQADMFESGLMLMAWGLFKKVVIADNLAPFVNVVFDHPEGYSGIAVSSAVVFFAFQIYCDFSGYTDVARGTARTLGFELTRNFDHPYIARNPVDFWRRWHISLSQWFQDYLYFPLAMRYMRRGGWGSKYKPHIIAMVLIGFWHGANWTFIVFGLYWGLMIAGYLYVMERLGERPLQSRWSRLRDRAQPLWAALSIASMFVVVCGGWILFRSESMTAAGEIVARLGSGTGAATVIRAHIMDTWALWLLIAGLLAVEWAGRHAPAIGKSIARTPAVIYAVRTGLLAAVLYSYLDLQQGSAAPFIYFQF